MPTPRADLKPLKIEKIGDHKVNLLRTRNFVGASFRVLFLSVYPINTHSRKKAPFFVIKFRRTTKSLIA